MAGSEHLQYPTAAEHLQYPQHKHEQADSEFSHTKARHREEEKHLRVAYGEGDPVEVGHYSKTLPRPRKVWIIFVGLSSLFSLVFITIAIVHPTPSFGKSVLFKMRSIEEASLLRRRLTGNDPPAGSGWVDSDQSITPATTTLKPEISAYKVPNMNISPVEPSQERHFGNELEARDTGSVRSQTRMSTTFTTVTATSLIRATSRRKSMTSCTTSTSLPPKPKASKVSKNLAAFVALYIGALGVCLDQKDAFRICSSASVIPSFASTYEESTLPQDVIKLLPTGTSGGTVFLIAALILYLVAVFSFALAYKGSVTARTAKGYRAYVRARYIHFLGLATVANFVGVILTVTALLIFRKVFQEALEEIPKLPYELFPGGGGATTPLAVTCATGAISTLASIYILIGDIRLIVTENVEARRQKAKADERLEKKKQRRSESDAFRTNRNKAIPTSVPLDIPSRSQVQDAHKAGSSKEHALSPVGKRGRTRSSSFSFLRKFVSAKPKTPARFLDAAVTAEDKPALQGAHAAAAATAPLGQAKKLERRPTLRNGDKKTSRYPKGTDLSFADVARAQDSGILSLKTRYSDPDEGDWQPDRQPIPPPFKRPRRTTIERLRDVFRLQ